MVTDKWIEKMASEVSATRTEFYFYSHDNPGKLSMESSFPLASLANNRQAVGIMTWGQSFDKEEVRPRFNIPCSARFRTHYSGGDDHVLARKGMPGFIDFIGVGQNLTLLKLQAIAAIGNKDYFRNDSTEKNPKQLDILSITYAKHYSKVNGEEVVREIVVDARLLHNAVPAFFFERPNNYYIAAVLVRKDEDEVNVLTYSGQINTDLEYLPGKHHVLKKLNDMNALINQGHESPKDAEKLIFEIFEQYLNPKD